MSRAVVHRPKRLMASKSHRSRRPWRHLGTLATAVAHRQRVAAGKCGRKGYTMQIGTVDSTTLSVTNSSSSSSPLLPTQTLNQQDFLNLLVTELQNQDPMNPMSDTDFIAQMAQFSTLQQAQQTYQSISETQAANLIGAAVTVSGTGGVTTTGTVTSVLMNSGTPEIVVNGQPYTLDEVLSVTPASTSASATGSSTTPTSQTSNN